MSEKYVLYKTKACNERVKVGSILCSTMRGALLKVIEIRTNGGLLAESHGGLLHGIVTPSTHPRRTAFVQPYADSCNIYNVPDTSRFLKGTFVPLSGEVHCCYRHVTLVPVEEVTWVSSHGVTVTHRSRKL